MPKKTTFDTQHVLLQATSVFHKKGYHGTSMQDLVDVTGLNRSSIYNSFGCKLQLYLMTLKNYRDSVNQKTTQLLVQSKDAISSIETILHFYIDEIVKDTDNKGCFIVNCKSEMANQEFQITQFLMHSQEESLKTFESLVFFGQQEGIINTKKDAQSYALYLLSSVQGLRMTGILVKEKAQLKAIVTTIIQTIT